MVMAIKPMFKSEYLFLLGPNDITSLKHREET